MLTIFLAIAAAYLFDLGIMGSMFVTGLLQIQREHGKLNGLAMAILTAINGCLTLGGIFMVAILYGKYKADMTDASRIAFAITIFVMLGLLYIVAKEWNRLLLKEKRD